MCTNILLYLCINTIHFCITKTHTLFFFLFASILKSSTMHTYICICTNYSNTEYCNENVTTVNVSKQRNVMNLSLLSFSFVFTYHNCRIYICCLCVNSYTCIINLLSTQLHKVYNNFYSLYA